MGDERPEKSAGRRPEKTWQPGWTWPGALLSAMAPTLGPQGLAPRPHPVARLPRRARTRPTT
eukprot:11160756-Lingulodinium_polyedra.AAC.1